MTTWLAPALGYTVADATWMSGTVESVPDALDTADADAGPSCAGVVSDADAVDDASADP